MTFNIDELDQIIQKNMEQYGIINENKTSIFNTVMNYEYNVERQLKTAYLSTKTKEYITKIKTKFDYLNSKEDKILKIQTFEKGNLKKSIVFEYDKDHELTKKTILKQGKHKTVLNYIGIP